MFSYPEIALTLLNGFLFILPLFVLRFGLPALVSKQALSDLQFFPPVEGVEQTALRVYTITNLFLVFSPLLARIQAGTQYFFIGLALYLLGVALLALALLHFSAEGGLTQRGIYRFTRNPIYIGYFLFYLGIAFIIGSWTYLVVTVIYQLSVHWLILSEERWCAGKYGEDFRAYCERTPRYL
jgi:protein-S-isoprenylcysteine O-methyltransferase Ste14